MKKRLQHNIPMNSNQNYVALVVAAGRSAINSIARRAQLSHRAFSLINRESMIVKVLDTLSASKMIQPITLAEKSLNK